MTKPIKIKINFSESDIQEMLDAVSNGESTEVFVWSPQSEDGKSCEVTITVGSDEE